MSDGSKSERLQIVLTPEELEMLDDWRFTYRMPSRAATIRELIKRGLACTETNAGMTMSGGGRRSRDVRILDHKGNGVHPSR